MESLPIKPETAAKLEELARLRSQDPIKLGGEALEDWLAQKAEEFEESCKAIEQGLRSARAGLGSPADQVFSELRRTHGIPD